MKRLVYLILMFFLVAGCQFKNQGNDYSWDFGRIKEGVILSHNFIIKNGSKNTLNIKEVNSSCGCTVSSVKKKVLLPGESTETEVKFDTKGYKGLIQQFVYVHTDDLNNPILKFTVKADIIK